MHLINTRLGAVDDDKPCTVRFKGVPLGHPPHASAAQTLSSFGRTKVLSHAILALTNRGSKINLLLGFCTYTY